jgi:hypothetical protein
MNGSNVSRALIGATLTAALVGCGTEGNGGDTARAGATGTAAGTAVGTSPSTGATTAATGAFVDPDAATREQLMTIPGMTASTADALIAGRPYQNMTAVDRVLAQSNLTEQQRDTVYTRSSSPALVRACSTSSRSTAPIARSSSSGARSVST